MVFILIKSSNSCAILFLKFLTSSYLFISVSEIASKSIQHFKKGDAFVEMAPRPLVFVEVNEVKVPQNYTNENGGKTGGKVGGDVPSLSPALSQVLSPDEEKDASTDAKDAISSSKVATLDEKVASSEPKVATSEEKVASPKKKISSEEMAIYILEYCSTWRSMDEIAQFANRDKNYIRNKVLPRLAEKLEKEYPDVPNHPRQRYRTIGRS